jgi:hypothetical protein
MSHPYASNTASSNSSWIVWTGSKSIHAWFHSPPTGVLQSLKNNACALGIDPGLIGRPEHPCRLLGQRHSKTGGMSRVLWLQAPNIELSALAMR